MEKTEYIYRVTETNVDGCGGSATMFVSFPSPVTGTLAHTFSECLAAAKRDAGDDSDTEDMIEDALVKFARAANITGTVCEAPYEGAFEF